MGYAWWTLPAEAIRDGDKNTILETFEGDNTLKEEYDLFLVVDKNMDIIYGVVDGKTIEENSEQNSKIRNKQLEENLFNLTEKKYNEFITPYLNDLAKYTSLKTDIETPIIWHAIEEYNNSIRLLSLSPISTDRGFPLTKGFYLFGKKLEEIVKEAETIIPAKIEITNKKPDQAFAYVELKGFNAESKVYVTMTPKVYIANIARNAMNILIIFEIILAAIAFLIIYPLFTKKYTKNLHKTIAERTDELTSNISLLDATLEATQDGIVVVDRNGNTVKYNHQFKEMCKIPEDVLLQLGNHKVLYYLKDQLLNEKEFEEKMIYLYSHPEEGSYDILEFKNEEIYELYSNPQRIKEKAIGRVLSFRNVTKQKQSEEEIKRYIEDIQEQRSQVEENAFQVNQLNLKLKISENDLEELNARKDKFFSIIAHDLKSPFTGLLGLTEMIIEECETFTKKEMKEIIIDVNGSAKKIFTLLQNLLNWSMLQTGRMDFTPENIDLSEVCDQVTGLLINNSRMKEINLVNEVNKSILAYADKNMVYTVLRNLISNSLKFTHNNGNVILSAKETNKMIEVTVSDDGIGMNKEDINKLFKIDIHHSTKGTENESGTGLGLILCSELVERNGGKIWVTSEFGKGSKFNFSIQKPK
jgi:signal transduction histidine kinase